MTQLASASIGWKVRDGPLQPVAVMALGGAVADLADSVSRAVALGDRLAVSIGEGVLVVTGDGAGLPWAPNVTYIAPDNGVWLPCVVQPEHALLVGLAAKAAARDSQGGLVILIPDNVVYCEVPRSPINMARVAQLARGAR